MKWHYRLGHMYPSKKQRLVKCGYLPKGLSTIKHHAKCKVCQHAKRHRSNQRDKGECKKVCKSTYPGQGISVDQLESSTEGFYRQMKGKLTKQRYKYATIFVDQFSWYTYIHLQSSLTSSETIEAK